MEFGRGSFVEMEWPYSFYFIYLFIYYLSLMVGELSIVCPARISIFFCFTPRNSSSARLGQNSRASTSISSIAKMRSSSLICLLAVIVASRANR